MSHGLIPDELLPRAFMTFLLAAWELSLEWQFHVGLTFFRQAFGSATRMLLCLIVCALLLTASEKNILGCPILAALVATSGFFAIGAIAAASAYLMLAFSSAFLPILTSLDFRSVLV
jgi:TRAP-type C4-dicarboxylate transport system permease small subunit